MTPEELRRRVEAVHRWAQAHDAAASQCPVCGGVKWVFHLDTRGRYVPRACCCCGYVQWFDAKLLGVEPLPAGDGRETPRGKGRAAP
jgi:hypothetical protein